MYKYRLSNEAEEDVVRIFEYGLNQFGFYRLQNITICFMLALTKLRPILSCFQWF